jgi:S1-C subfamily serine protease
MSEQFGFEQVELHARREIVMRRSRVTLLVCLALIVSGTSLSSSGQTLPQSTMQLTMPKTGAPSAAVDNDREQLRGDNPIPNGISFEELGKVVESINRPSSRMRGAQEIAAYRLAAPAVVLLLTKDESGSGVVLESGQILTNRHVVEGVGRVQAFFKSADQTPATEVREGQVKFVDPSRDLALIELVNPPSDMKFLKISGRDDIDVGTDVYAIGHPLGVYTWTFTQGVVSGIRQIAENNQNYTAIQTQTPINPGNSGGPLLDTSLEVVGINTWVRDISSIEKLGAADQEGVLARPAQGLNFAVSAKDVRSFLSEAATGKLKNLALEWPSTPGCSWEGPIFDGRAETNDANLQTYSTRCDKVADAWLIFPDDKSKPDELYIDPDRSGKSSIIVRSDPTTDKWQTSLWDFFRDQTFAVIGYHDDGSIKPSRFEFRN